MTTFCPMGCYWDCEHPRPATETGFTPKIQGVSIPIRLPRVIASSMLDQIDDLLERLGTEP